MSINIHCNTIFISSLKGCKDCLVYFLENGVDPNIQNEGGWSPLHFACCNGNMDIVKILLNSGASPNIKNIYGRTPGCAIWNNQETCIELLLSYSISNVIY
jgi:ankyrin repeat protein